MVKKKELSVNAIEKEIENYFTPPVPKPTLETSYEEFLVALKQFHECLQQARTKVNSQQSELNYAYSIIAELWTRLPHLKANMDTALANEYKPTRINPVALG